MIGTIHPDAYNFFRNKRDLLNLLKPFQEFGFDVTWANERRSQNTFLTVALLKPKKHLSDIYSFEYEIVVAYSKYNKTEPRTLRAIEQIMSEDPIRGRVETLWYYLISEDENVISWIRSYLLEQKESKIIIPFIANEIRRKDDQFLIKNRMQAHFISLDRFKHTLPLHEDTYFFGRTKEIGEILDNIRRGENVGLFGLRKTGKTSMLLKLYRLYKQDKNNICIFFDAQSPAIRKNRWFDLLKKIVTILANNFESIQLENKDYKDNNASENFENDLKYIHSKTYLKKLILIIDEIEWLTPNTCKDKHWENDFVDFWQTIRSIQTYNRNISILLAGVNPSIVELDRFENIQNPLFGIISPIYLSGLEEEEITDMLNKIGKVMGIEFPDTSIDFLYKQYNGHPLLTRFASSIASELCRSSGKDFPIKIHKSDLVSESEIRDSELLFYVKHVISELELFYPNEYKILEYLCIDDYDSYFNELKVGHSIGHLVRYGIINNISSQYPFVTYSVIKDYVASENARKEGRTTKYKICSINNRDQFLKLRIRNIIDDIRNLERLIKQKRLPSLFGSNSFPEADKLINIIPPNNMSDLENCLNTLNKCFVESIENFGIENSNNKYFWNTIVNTYPTLHDALHRIKVYRNNANHLQLNDSNEKKFKEYLNRDIDTTVRYDDTEKAWIILQRTLDELLRSLQIETSKIELAK